jgi:hypothetical protein
MTHPSTTLTMKWVPAITIPLATGASDAIKTVSIVTTDRYSLPPNSYNGKITSRQSCIAPINKRVKPSFYRFQIQSQPSVAEKLLVVMLDHWDICACLNTKKKFKYADAKLTNNQDKEIGLRGFVLLSQVNKALFKTYAPIVWQFAKWMFDAYPRIFSRQPISASDEYKMIRLLWGCDAVYTTSDVVSARSERGLFLADGEVEYLYFHGDKNWFHYGEDRWSETTSLKDADSTNFHMFRRHKEVTTVSICKNELCVRLQRTDVSFSGADTPDEFEDELDFKINPNIDDTKYFRDIRPSFSFFDVVVRPHCFDRYHIDVFLSSKDEERLFLFSTSFSDNTKHERMDFNTRFTTFRVFYVLDAGFVVIRYPNRYIEIDFWHLKGDIFESRNVVDIGPGPTLKRFETELCCSSTGRVFVLDPCDGIMHIANIALKKLPGSLANIFVVWTRVGVASGPLSNFFGGLVKTADDAEDDYWKEIVPEQPGWIVGGTEVSACCVQNGRIVKHVWTIGKP